MLFYCDKEKLDLLMFCVDYTKAFDFLEFGYIEKVVKLFNFGENIQKWLKIILTDGESRVSNNGFLSNKFKIKRSTRQGDPLSPIIFVLGLEILFIAIRADKNIRGVVLNGQEVKLTAFADDATYFLKDEHSASNLLSTIESFSKISGLNINKTKSECMILQFESKITNYDDHFLNVPVVDTVKVLGHYFGKNKMICNYHNFYSKLIKIEKRINIWKQRGLTIFGKNVLINTFINSQILYNSQIELPPQDFIKILEKIKKQFLWGGNIAKIAHKSIIGTKEQGGFNYIDMQHKINSLNVKFILKLTKCRSGRSILPQYWISECFEVSSNIKDADRNYYRNFFSNYLCLIEDCFFKLPPKRKWKGHPFYYSCLETLHKLASSLPTDIIGILSTPLWHNKFLGTKFDCKLSRAGFNYIRDIIHEGKVLPEIQLKSSRLTQTKINLLRKIAGKLDSNLHNTIYNYKTLNVVIYPRILINLGNSSLKVFNSLTSREIYNLSIETKTKTPTGLFNWKNKLDISDQRIENGLVFAFLCTLSTRSRVFQFKLCTYIIPTGEYLFNYHVRDNYLCDKCHYDSGERDNIIHSIFNCIKVRPLVQRVFFFLINECNATKEITLTDYLFGFQGKENNGLNCILLELKQYIFYDWGKIESINMKFKIFKNKIRKIILLEKNYYLSHNKLNDFFEKWKYFSPFYDMYGPDPQF